MAEGERVDFSSAAYWDEVIQHDPARACSLGRTVATESDDPTTITLARGAASRALFDLGRLGEARVEARAALEASEQGVDDDVRWSIGMSAAVIIAESGSIDRGLSVLDQLHAESDGVHRGRVELQRAYVLHFAGRLNDALVELDACERSIGDAGEARDRCRVRQIRGLVLLQQGRLDGAEIDLIEAERLAGDSGLTLAEAQSVANRAVVYGRARRLHDAVSAFEQAALRFERAGNPARAVAHMEIDRAEVMMLFGLSIDAEAAASRAVELVAPSGNKMLLGDAQLMLARAQLASGRVRLAVSSAEAASRTFETSGRAEMVAHARSVAAQALLHTARTESQELALTHAREVVEALYGDGWHQHADELLMARVRSASRHDLMHRVADDLEHLRLGAWSDQRDIALAGWFAEALARRHESAPASALDGCRLGLGLLDDIVAEAPTLEQRSAAMRLGDDLSRLAIELAVDMGDSDTALAAAEGTRGRALHYDNAAASAHRPLSIDGAAQLRRELAARLGGRTMVEWLVVRDRVWAVVFDAMGSRLVDVASRADVVRARDRVLVWLDLAAAEPDDSSNRAVRAARLLDDLLIAPLDLPLSGGILLVPVDVLHAIPWSGLPSLAGRSVSLCPTGQLWLDSDRRAATLVESVAVIEGPDMPEASAERDAIVSTFRSAAVASGDGATAATVRSMLSGYDMVHLAAHGAFRSDHPLLSTIRLADGSATMYDAVPERVVSRLVVLSSCEGGAHGVSDGSEVLGLSAVLLARGAASVVAPLTVVRDLECSEFVVELHAELDRGQTVAEAIATVRSRWLGDDDLSRWAVASSFTCFGSGGVTVAAG